MVYAALADVTLALHLAFIVFIVLGGLAVARWPRMAWVHLPADPSRELASPARGRGRVSRNLRRALSSADRLPGRAHAKRTVRSRGRRARGERRRLRVRHWSRSPSSHCRFGSTPSCVNVTVDRLVPWSTNSARNENVEARGWQGAPSEEYRVYVSEAQRSQPGCIGVLIGQYLWTAVLAL